MVLEDGETMELVWLNEKFDNSYSIEKLVEWITNHDLDVVFQLDTISVVSEREFRLIDNDGERIIFRLEPR